MALGDIAQAIIAAVVVAVCAIIGPLVYPLVHRSPKAVFLAFMTFAISLGAGVLIGDALLHLLPEALGLHSHDDDHDEGDDHDHEHEETPTNLVAVCLLVFAGIYIFYFIEKCLTPLLIPNSMQHYVHGHGHGHGHSHNYIQQVPDIKSQNGHIKEGEHAHNGEQSKDILTSLSKAESSTETSGLLESNVNIQAKEAVILIQSPIANEFPVVAIFVIVTDAVHNIVDGIAIGAAFSISSSIGWSTTLAIILHEIPHELGDYMILMSVGLSVRTAILWTAFSQVLGFVGLAVGLALNSLNAEQYFLAITAGMFLYIALVDLLPQMDTSQGDSAHLSRGASVFFQNLGLLLGVALMVIVVYIE